MVAGSTVASKSSLEQAISVFDRVRVRGRRELEQYPTPTEIAAHMVWTGLLKGDIENATVADFGCGDGRLAVASLLAGSQRAVCVEIDEDMVEHGKNVVENYFPSIAPRLIHVISDATIVELRNVDTIVMNPPFGIVRGNRGLDVKFLANALRNGRSVYSIHKYSNGLIRLLEEIAKEHCREVIWFEVLNLAIPMIYERHRRRVYPVKSVFVALAPR